MIKIDINTYKDFFFIELLHVCAHFKMYSKIIHRADIFSAN